MFNKKEPAGKHAWTATVGTKGQIVISKQARDMFGIKPGDTLLLMADVKRGICIPTKEKTDKLLSTVFFGMDDMMVDSEDNPSE